MENQKNGKGKTAAIVILIVLLIGAVGYIAYEKITSSDKNLELENEVKTLKSEIKQLKSSVKSDEDIVEAKKTETQSDGQVQNTNYINAIYWGSADDNSETSEVVLFSDGKCLSLHVGSEYHLGTYKIENGQLIITLSVYDSTTTEVYNISNDYKTIRHVRGSYNLNRINQ